VFIEAKDDVGGGDNWTTGAISRAKLKSNHHHQQTNIQFSCHSCHPTNSQSQSKHWKEVWISLIICHNCFIKQAAIGQWLRRRTCISVQPQLVPIWVIGGSRVTGLAKTAPVPPIKVPPTLVGTSELLNYGISDVKFIGNFL